jgi:hypothetical protein
MIVMNDYACEMNNIWRQSIPGFAAWWTLQFRRGYIPFLSNINVRCKISGTL